MALKKSKLCRGGITAEYWKINAIEMIYLPRAKTIIKMDLYVSKSHRNNGYQGIESKSFDIGDELINTVYNGNSIMQDINTQLAYRIFKKRVAEEAGKPKENQDNNFAWFADAKDD